ncbi:MAG: exodeoxyribonuclease VII small subunit [Bdellovibrionales bacterium]
MEFEKNLQDLEKIVEKMSEEQISLTEAIKSFKKGMEIVKKCQKELTRAEQEVEKLIGVKDDGKLETTAFKEDE